MRLTLRITTRLQGLTADDNHRQAVKHGLGRGKAWSGEQHTQTTGHQNGDDCTPHPHNPKPAMNNGSGAI